MLATAAHALKRSTPRIFLLMAGLATVPLPLKRVAVIGAAVMQLAWGGGALRRTGRIGKIVAILVGAGLLAGCMRSSTDGTGINGGVSIATGNGDTFANSGTSSGSDSVSSGESVSGDSYSYSGPDAVVGSGRLTNRTIRLPGITSVVVGANFVVRLKTGSAMQATVTMDDNLTDRIETTVNGNELRLGVRPGISVRNATLRADVTVGRLERLVTNGASRVDFTSPITESALQLDAEGTSAVSGPVAIDQLKAMVSGAATLGLSGQVHDLNVTVTGASQLPLTDLTARNLDITLAGASHATVTVTDTLSAQASDASLLYYRGSPKIAHEQTSGTSSIMPDS